jgi:hypothetical protein
MGVFVVGLGLPGYPSPGSNCPATNIAMLSSFQSALATISPFLHIDYCDVAGIGGWAVSVDRSNGLRRRYPAGHFPVNVSYHFN